MKRKVSTVLSGVGIALLAVSSAMAAPVCLNTRDIVSSTPNRDGTAITFTMRNGQVWRNDLQGRCPDLRFEGFVWTIQGPEEVCERQQSLRVIRSGQICVLGKFTQIPRAPRG